MENSHNGLKVVIAILVIAMTILTICTVNLANENDKYNKFFGSICRYYTTDINACKTGVQMMKSMNTDELDTAMKLYSKR